jgi:hypothetical protein
LFPSVGINKGWDQRSRLQLVPFFRFRRIHFIGIRTSEHWSVNELLIKRVSFSDDTMSVTFNEGPEVPIPLGQFARLQAASLADRNQWQLIGGGIGVHWPKMDEDLSVENILAAYRRSKRKQYAQTPAR